MNRSFLLFLSIILLFSALVRPTQGQSGQTLFGDVKVDESKAAGLTTIGFDIILYNLSGQIVARQTVSSNGRYRFINLSDGHYDLVVESENVEVARIRIELMSPIYKTDFRQDINLEWKTIANASVKPSSVSSEDYYKRSSSNQKRFDKAGEAADKKKYVEAATLLKLLTSDDPNDFQAWTELGTAYLAQENFAEAEKAYQRAVEVRPRFFLGLMNLGRLRMMRKNFEEAILVLSVAVEVKPVSAEANFLLGEAYLQIKKGSKAVGYFYEALKLDPAGKADAHLRLAALYHGAGMKDKAASEYEQFLKKRPDYSDKRKLEKYIADNKKP
jgi:tetratricopeptide (TPR) repeat protein